MQSIIREITGQFREAGYFPTACVRVFDREKTLAVYHTEGCTENSLFDVASLTKIATATRVLLSASAGELELDAELGEVFAEIAQDDFLSRRLKGVTIRMLLTHTSTITPWFPFYSRRGEDFWQVFRYALAHTAPVEGMEYSDLNFMLLGKWWEKRSGLTLRDCLQRDLVQPLGLGNMMFHPPQNADIVPSSFDNRIEMDMCRERGIAVEGWRPLHTPVKGTVNDGNAHYYFGDAAGHAGIFADALAYQRLCQFYMNTDLPLLAQAQREQPGAPTRGLGLQTGPMYPDGCGHTGFTGTSIYFSAQANIGVVAFTNRLYYDRKNPNATGDFRRALHEAVYEKACQRGGRE